MINEAIYGALDFGFKDFLTIGQVAAQLSKPLVPVAEADVFDMLLDGRLEPAVKLIESAPAFRGVIGVNGNKLQELAEDVQRYKEAGISDLHAQAENALRNHYHYPRIERVYVRNRQSVDRRIDEDKSLGLSPLPPQDTFHSGDESLYLKKYEPYVHMQFLLDLRIRVKDNLFATVRDEHSRIEPGVYDFPLPESGLDSNRKQLEYLRGGARGLSVKRYPYCDFGILLVHGSDAYRLCSPDGTWVGGVECSTYFPPQRRREMCVLPDSALVGVRKRAMVAMPELIVQVSANSGTGISEVKTTMASQKVSEQNRANAQSRGVIWKQAIVELYNDPERNNELELSRFSENNAEKALNTSDGKSDKAPKFRTVYDYMLEARKKGMLTRRR